MPLKSSGWVKLPMPLGVNVDAVPLALTPGDSPSMENVSLEKGSIRVRLGENAYINKAHNNIASGVRSMCRYRTDSGTKQIVLSSGLYIYADSDNGNFNIVSTSALQNADGFVDFSQYRNSLGIFSENTNPVWYNALATPDDIVPVCGPFDWYMDVEQVPSGGILRVGFFVYAVTFDIYQGDDFLGETGSAVSSSGVYARGTAQTVDVANDSSVVIRRPSTAIVNGVPSYCKTMNIYRSPIFDSAASINIGTKEDYTNLYYVGSVDMGAVRTASETDVIFTDTGQTPLGKQISYGVRWYPIRPRYTVFHKGRLWGSYCNVAPNASAAVYTLDPDGVYYSRFFSNGVEPIVFQTTSPKVELDPYSGEGNTGLASWRNTILLAFKPTSTHAILGGDDIISPTIPQIKREILSPTVGCIAPQTIVQAEGAVLWMSHRGPEIFDGTGPRPLNADKIRPLFDLIPASRRRMMAAYYDSKDREYVVFWTHITELTTNRRAFVYSFITKEWTLRHYERGIGCVVEVNDTNLNRRLLFGYDDLSSYFNTFTNDPIVVYGKTAYENGLNPQTPIEWNFYFPPLSFGDATTSVKVSAVRLEGKFSDPVRVAFVAHGIKGTVDTTATPLTIPPLPSGVGMSEEVPVKLSSAITGQFIQVVLSGETSTAQTDITGVWLSIEPVGRA